MCLLRIFYSNSISSVALRWLPRSLLAVRVHCLRRSLVSALFHLRNGIGIRCRMMQVKMIKPHSVTMRFYYVLFYTIDVILISSTISSKFVESRFAPAVRCFPYCKFHVDVSGDVTLAVQFQPGRPPPRQCV